MQLISMTTITVSIIIALIITAIAFAIYYVNNKIKEEENEINYGSRVDPYDEKNDSSSGDIGFQKPPLMVSEKTTFNQAQKVYMYEVVSLEPRAYKLVSEYDSLRQAERDTGAKRYKIKKSCNQKKILKIENNLSIVFSFNKNL